MKTNTIALIIISIVAFSACKSSKTTTSSNSPVPQASVNSPKKSETGIYSPGNEELTAIQMQYKEVTIDKLKEGYSLYAEGACTKCHGPKNIYKRDVAEWKSIVDRMAQKAKITDEQKDAVYKYVLSIKATQPK